LPRFALTLGLLFLLSGKANADLSVNNIELYGGGSSLINPNATIVEVQFTGNSGVWVYGDAQTATNWTNPNGSSIPLYCIDLVHDNYQGSSYNLTTWSNPSSFSSDALNRVAWAAENASLSAYGPAATQLLIWSVIDPNFQVRNWNGDSALQSAYHSVVSAMNSEYNRNTNYLAQAQFFDAVHQPQSYLNQDLAVGVPPGGFRPNGFAAPEPSSLLITGLGALGLIGQGWWGRRAGCGSRWVRVSPPTARPQVSEQSQPSSFPA